MMRKYIETLQLHEFLQEGEIWRVVICVVFIPVSPYFLGTPISSHSTLLFRHSHFFPFNPTFSALPFLPIQPFHVSKYVKIPWNFLVSEPSAGDLRNILLLWHPLDFRRTCEQLTTTFFLLTVDKVAITKARGFWVLVRSIAN